MNKRWCKRNLALLIALSVSLLSFQGYAQEPSPGFNPDYIALAQQYHEDNNGISFMIMKDGQIVYEAYTGIGSPQRAHELASGTKSFTGIMAAFAVQDGLMKWDELAVETLPEWEGHPIKSRITLRQILWLTSGIRGGNKPGDVPTYEEAIEAPALFRPDMVFMYDSAPFQIFGEIMRRKLEPLGIDPLEYLDQKLFQPLNIKYGFWRKGRDGNPHLPSGAFLTARNWATFGEFVRKEGQWNDETLLDPDLLRECFVGSGPNPGYGLTWWLNREIPKAIRDRNRMIGHNYLWDHPAIPRDLVRAAGAGGQRLYISQNEGWVIVRQATNIREALERGTEFDEAKFLSLLLTGKAKEASFSEHCLMVGNMKRFFHAYLPSSYNKSEVWPLVLFFHGGGGTAAISAWETRWHELAEAESFIAVFPEGTRDDPDAPPEFGSNGQSWNDGSGRANVSAVKRKVDDVAFIKKLIEHLSFHFNIDPNRIYATGFSNGGSMSFRVGRELSDIIAAIAPVASTDWMETPELLEPVSLMYITGTQDPLNPMEGGRIRIGFRDFGIKPPVEKMLEKWKAMLDCDDKEVVYQDDDEIKHYAFKPAQQKASMEVYYVKELGHHWPGGQILLPEWLAGSTMNIEVLDATEVIWDFFNRHPKPFDG